jgi:putative SOS response-associated peptidase YedK
MMPPKGGSVCNLYSHVKGPKAIRDLANAMGSDWLDSAGNLEPQPAIFPDAVAAVVRSRPEGDRELIKMRRGFPIPEPKPDEKKKSATGPTFAIRIGAIGFPGWKPGTAASCRPAVFPNTIGAPRRRP